MEAQQVAEIERTAGTCLDQGDLRGAATVVMRGYGPEILGYLVALLRDEDAAFEVFSEFSERLWRGISGFRRESALKTWSYQIAWNAAKNYRNAARHRRERPFESGELSDLAEEIRSTTRPYLKREVADRMTRLRQRLAPDEQSLLILRVDRGLSWTEVAEVFSDGPRAEAATLRKRFERVRRKLFKLAREEGLLDG